MQVAQAESRIHYSLALPIAGPESDEDAARDQVWPGAYEQWLDGGWNSRCQAVSSHTRRAYRRAVNEFRAFIGEQYPMWRVTASQVAGWQNAMRSRDLSAATISLRLAGLSSLFDFLVDQFPLLVTCNPVESIQRPQISPRKSRGLAQDEAQALLRRINRSTVAGLQDYALVITLLDTGWLSSRVAHLKWSDLLGDELPDSARAAIWAYLQAAGRIGTMGDGNYVFVALSDVAGRLPNVKDLDRAKPLSGTMISRIVKKCARRAGLDESRINTHTLRFTTTRTYAIERDEHESLWKSVGAFFSMV
jgi:site-specific recombinase XerD